MTTANMRIVIEEDGPYRVEGGIPLVRKLQVVTEHGEPVAWYRSEKIRTGEIYELCRCGHSEDLPFCDSSHRACDFDGTETADVRPTAERQTLIAGPLGPDGQPIIVVKQDGDLCMEAGFCGTRAAGLSQMVSESGATEIRSLIAAMAERCPSGSYTYSLPGAAGDIEPDLPPQIAVTTEATSEGPIVGPYWVTGGIPIERSDGQPFEVRNRVMLCGCGLSGNKPLCDGTHRREHFTG